MLARVTTFTIDGLSPRRVWVEVDIRKGLPSFAVVGLADIAVREARQRVRAAILNSGFDFPGSRITANLAPAYLRKVGPGFDLALAVGVLAASGQVPLDGLDGCAVFGELSLSGELRPGRGALAVAEGAVSAGLARLIVPDSIAAEAALVPGIEIGAARNLGEVADVLRGGEPSSPPPGGNALPLPVEEPDLADVRGHAAPLHALEIAAAGGHNLLFEGAPGTGKTMLARRLPSILPPLAREEAVEVTRIHSVAGLHRGASLVSVRPFRAPHHTISPSGLVGGGSIPAPGEVTLAHHGVLFLDELSEFPRSTLEALRQPLEDGRVAIVRGQRALIFPSDVMLVAATNPCPCGFAGVDDRCQCTPADLARHARRLSGPLIDRLDLLVSVHRPRAAELAAPPLRTSAEVRARVLAARERQAARLSEWGKHRNGQLDARLLARHIRLDARSDAVLARAYERDGLSARAHLRILRVARTLADLAGRDAVAREDITTALAYRQRGTALAEAA